MKVLPIFGSPEDGHEPRERKIWEDAVETTIVDSDAGDVRKGAGGKGKGIVNLLRVGISLQVACEYAVVRVGNDHFGSSKKVKEVNSINEQMTDMVRCRASELYCGADLVQKVVHLVQPQYSSTGSTDWMHVESELAHFSIVLECFCSNLTTSL